MCVCIHVAAILWSKLCINGHLRRHVADSNSPMLDNFEQNLLSIGQLKSVLIQQKHLVLIQLSSTECQPDAAGEHA